MSWNSIIGQHRVKNILQHAITENKIAHGYCFWGMNGVGKDALALEFAKVVNCIDPLVTNNSIEACESCRSCHQANKLEHPNIKLVFSLPAGKSTDSRDDSPVSRLTDDQIKLIQEQMQLKSENPYHDITIPNASQIRISSIRDVKKSVTMSASQAGRRVVIISNADEMTTEAANAFLKTLEEPHDQVTLILTTARHDTLPQTILSRCQQIYCEPLSDEDITSNLVAKMDVDPSEARLISSFAQGSYAKACEFMDEDMRAMRLDVVDILRSALKRSAYRAELLTKIDKLTGEKDRTRVEMMLMLLMLWLRDCYTYSLTGIDSMIINIDQQETIGKFSGAFEGADYPAAIQAVEEAISHVRRNVQLQLTILTMLITCRRIFLREVA
ncbi:MAG: AAA family ATPase [Ignavibacteria bacterium]|nr:AAA family ATPase [Ignavibacteria bacterium]